MIRPGGLFIIAAGLCGIALINRASKPIADSIDQFTDADGRTASLANVLGEGVCSDPETSRGDGHKRGRSFATRNVRTHSEDCK